MRERNTPNPAEHASEPVGRADLPDTLFPALTRPVRDHNPHELDVLACKPQRLVPLPEVIEDEGKRRRMANLAQYAGRTRNGQRRALANLRRRQKMPEHQPVQPDPDVPAPRVPTPTRQELQQLPKHPPITGIWLKRVLQKDEHDVYVETWNEIWKAHRDEYTDPLDMQDVHTICLENAIQLRMLRIQNETPRRFSPKAYHDSAVRMQKARENLASRRVDRIGSKAHIRNLTQNNIAVLAGEVNEKQVREIVEQDEAEQMAFLEGTEQGNQEVRRLLRMSEDQAELLDREKHEQHEVSDDETAPPEGDQ